MNACKRDQILAILKRKGPSATWHFRILGVGTSPECRRVLRKLQAEGIVRLSRYTTPNNLVWELTP